MKGDPSWKHDILFFEAKYLEDFTLVDFEYDKTFSKSMVSDFFHLVLSVLTVGENRFWEEKFHLKTHHKVASGVES